MSLAVQNHEPDRFAILLAASENLVMAQQKQGQEIEAVKQEVSEIRQITNRLPGDSRMQLSIKLRATKHVTRIVGGTTSPLYRKTISALWRDYWQAFAVTSYRDTPAAMYDEAISYIDRWRPIELAGLEK